MRIRVVGATGPPLGAGAHSGESYAVTVRRSQPDKIYRSNINQEIIEMEIRDI